MSSAIDRSNDEGVEMTSLSYQANARYVIHAIATYFGSLYLRWPQSVSPFPTSSVHALIPLLIYSVVVPPRMNGRCWTS